MSFWIRISALAAALIMPVLAGLALAAEGDMPRVAPTAEAKAAAETLAKARDAGGGHAMTEALIAMLGNRMELVHYPRAANDGVIDGAGTFGPAMRAQMVALAKAMPDFRQDVTGIVANGDEVEINQVWTGSIDGEKARARLFAAYQIKDGKIVRMRARSASADPEGKGFATALKKGGFILPPVEAK
jgi:ketosteroid isomerase-like protein